MTLTIRRSVVVLVAIFIATAAFAWCGHGTVAAATGGLDGGALGGGSQGSSSDPSGIQACGSGADAYTPSIDLGCKGEGNPIMDLTFAIIRWLSDGVGLVIVGSVIVGGIQYTTSRGDPQATAAAVNRLRSAVTALFIFIFAYAILNYLIPGQVLGQ